MMKKILLLCVSILLTSCASVTSEIQSAAETDDIAIDDARLAASVRSGSSQAEVAGMGMMPSESMMMPLGAQKTKSGYAYIQLKPGSLEKPGTGDAVKVFLRVLNIEGTLIDEGETILSVSHSTPFLEEMISVMTVGEQIRVWGESQARIWEIELLSIDTSFRAPEDVASPPESAQTLTGFADVKWRVVEPGSGEQVKSGQAYRIHATRWNTRGEILESSKNGRGMLLIFNDEYAAQDPVHHALLGQMNPGMRVRLWIAGARVGMEDDWVEDFWIVERLPELEPPESINPPLDDPSLVVIEPDQAWIRFEVPGKAEKLADQSAVSVEMTCWNAETKKLIDATYLRAKPDIMDIRPELGVWHQIMTQASVGTTLTAWIKKAALPENVGMDMTCRVKILDNVKAKETVQ